MTGEAEMTCDDRGVSRTAGFATIVKSTQCIFAARSKIWYAEPAPVGVGPAEIVARTMAHFREFVDVGEAQVLDGFVFQLDDPSYGESLEQLAQTTYDVLASLSAHDPAASARPFECVGDENWWFTVFGQRFLALAFAPCYPPDSSRSTFGVNATFILLQPVHAFDRRTAVGTEYISLEIRERIRRAYARVGQTYDAELAQSDYEALKFVWPMRLGDPPVRWWERDDAVQPREDAQ